MKEIGKCIIEWMAGKRRLGEENWRMKNVMMRKIICGKGGI